MYRKQIQIQILYASTMRTAVAAGGRAYAYTGLMKMYFKF